MPEKVRILFVAANPKDSIQLRLDEEIREIHDKIRAAEFRDSFDLVSRWAVRPGDLLQAFYEVRPHIVHFSAHGTKHAELVLEDADGNAKPVSDTALAALFRTVKASVRLVLLNACHSQAQALAISKEVECTVGMSTEISDEAAVVFASRFYGALAFGLSVGEAYAQGRTALMLDGIAEETTPTLLVRPGTDALLMTFVNRRPTNPLVPAIAFEILLAAVNGNTPINVIRSEGSIVAVLAGEWQSQSGLDLEKSAGLEHAIAMLVQVGWLRPADHELFHVTHAGYEAARRLQKQPDPILDQLKEEQGAPIERI